MTDTRAWAIRPKWHRLESPRSYARRQSRAAGIPFEDVERGLTSEKQLYIYRVWKDEAAAAAIVEAAAGRPEGHYRRLRDIAQPDPSLTYPERFLCRLCSAGDFVEQIPHDRENWCLRHPGQMVWAGPGTTPGTQLVAERSDHQAKAERRFRRLVASGRVDPRLHARVWEMVRDNAWLTRPEGWKPELAPLVEDHEGHGRAALYPEMVRVLELLSDLATVHEWVGLPSTALRDAIASSLPLGGAPTDVLIERIVLWLRPRRREVRHTRIDPLDVPLDLVDTPTIIDVTAPYPLWIQRRPQAVAEWNWSRNDQDRDPWEPRGTSYKAWWTCDAGHTWQSTPYVRAIAGCPHCAGQAPWLGQSDLASEYPAVAAEWDRTPGSNAGDPDHVGARSNRRVNWVCGEGHRWTATIANRTRNGSGCPFCAGNRAVPGQTDLATVRPDLALEWDFERNGDLTPNVVGAFSAMKVWWTGECGHRWDAAINNRSSGQGCPMCAGKRAITGVTDLATVRPDLAGQWHSSNKLRPDEVVPGSGKKVVWQCAEGHTWTAAIYRRHVLGTGCPFCFGRYVIVGKTDLATVRPDLVSEWDASNARKPTEVPAGSKQRALWNCKHGHQWEAVIASRTGRRACGCPHCYGRRAVPGTTDLATLRPDLAAEWDVSNRSRPERVKPTSQAKVLWRCSSDHVWEASVVSRVNGLECPRCDRVVNMLDG
ncbi:zinc-ribbon domain-containing protein [Microbacterium sp. NPDC077184]|uniref:zinc-ribbon domain-containing protein n=1 Tax=Microbacterium sp. NPDC077184 TaxID=3154764 RepID=UPI003442B98A